MTTFQKTAVLDEIEGDAPFSKETLAYLGERLRNNYYDFILTKFAEAQEKGLTQAQIARRLNIGPDRVSKLLGAPGNWTIDTIAGLLAAISREEAIPTSRPYLGRPKANFDAEACLVVNAGSTTDPKKVGSSGSSSTKHVIPPLSIAAD
jgi:transcriptional regulator with XRE-family HTH domain